MTYALSRSFYVMKAPKTTEIYTHITKKDWDNLKSPYIVLTYDASNITSPLDIHSLVSFRVNLIVI
jgi:hypothetical protein